MAKPVSDIADFYRIGLPLALTFGAVVAVLWSMVVGVSS